MDTGGLAVLYATTLIALLWAAVACSAMARLTRVRIRRPRPRTAPMWLTGLIGSVGTGILIASPAGATGRRSSPSLVRSVASSEPWSETGGSTPLLPSVSDEAPWMDTGSDAPAIDPGGDVSGIASEDPAELHPWEEVESTTLGRGHDAVTPWGSRSDAAPPSADRPGSGDGSESHPAIHPERGGRPVTPLFPRHPQPQATERRSELEACARRHPAGKALPHQACAGGKKYVVQIGDTLWDIAASSLGTNDQRRIARYWPKIHRSNRSVIGSDPNHLLPGQKLELPNES